MDPNLPDTLTKVESGEQVTPRGHVKTATFIGRPLDDPVLAAARANPTMSIAVAGGGLVIARLLAVSGYRVDVALALLTSAGVANVVVGTATSLVPTAAPLLAFVLLDLTREYYRVQRRALVAAYGALVAAVVSLLVTPVFLLAVYAVAVVGLEGLARFRASRGRPAVRLPEDPIAYSLALLAFPFLLPLLLSSTPWLPPESIVSGGSVVVGYVTQTDSRWTHILLDAPRVVRIYETSAITSRTSCQMPSRALDATLLQIVAQPSALPDCRVP